MNDLPLRPGAEIGAVEDRFFTLRNFPLTDGTVMPEATTNNLSVSIALPGPIRPSHEPGWLPFAGLRPAKWWLAV